MLYDPDEMDEDSGKGGGKAEAGEYFFKVDVCDEFESKAGNNGLKLELKVHISDNRQIKIFDYLMFTKGALWKMRDFCNAVGVDFYKDNKMTARDYLGYVGKANFELGEENEKGNRYLSVEQYLPLEGKAKKVAPEEVEEEEQEESETPF